MNLFIIFWFLLYKYEMMLNINVALNIHYSDEWEVT